MSEEVGQDATPSGREETPVGISAREAMHEAYARIHVHGPFVFLLNQNHNALRGCITCGASWAGLMAGNADNLCWHPVAESPEEERGAFQPPAPPTSNQGG